ncbi:MAG: hypothetical protein QXN02_03455 [Ignisphaera sp.]
MKKNKLNLWFIQRIMMILLLTVYTAYCLLLNCLNILTITFLAIMVPCIANPRKVCRSIRLPLINGIAINYCGFLLPLYSTLILMICRAIQIQYLILLLSLAIAIAVVHTYTTEKMILVNVIRYSLSFVFLSMVITHSEDIYYILPFSTIMGIALGSDILPAIFMYRSLESEGKVLVIGGYMALDSIPISLIISLSILLVFRIMQLFGIHF